MPTPTLSPAQRRLLGGLLEAGGSGVFDRYVRIVAAGEALTTHGSTTPLTAFRDGYIAMDGKRVVLTEAGRSLAQSIGEVNDG